MLLESLGINHPSSVKMIMDGPVGGTNCPLLPGKEFTYSFVVEQEGTNVIYT